MVKCPDCDSVQMGYLVSPRTTRCFYCDARWVQDGADQTDVRPSEGHSTAKERRPASYSRASIEP
jgi:hypothetical protein